MPRIFLRSFPHRHGALMFENTAVIAEVSQEGRPLHERLTTS